MESLGQKEKVWTDQWSKLDISKEIQMWDFFGTRPWILKFTPRHGKVLEAGCGLGRYNFYLSQLGIDTTGLDFSGETIDKLNNWAVKQGYRIPFIQGDVTDLPFEDGSLSGYLSFGVVEHFIEGPQKALAEAFRVLRPGGIAIITTPNKSWYNRYGKLKTFVKTQIKKLIKHKIENQAFFQYEYSPRQLGAFVKKSGLQTALIEGGDYLFSFIQLGKYKYSNIYQGSKFVKLSEKLDKSVFRYFGAQSITISVKVAEKMHCFFCDELNAKKESLEKYTVPICDNCREHESSSYYLKSQKTYFHFPYSIEKDIKEYQIQKLKCDFCGNDYNTDTLFEKYGFNKNVCKKCLKKKDVNIELSNTSILPIWRKR